ncbi:hypothetical protein SF06_01230 [Pseudomonas flexibilis]|nr:hypothetical protein SF06_01230 [Pseudomonas flexibilis]
MCIWDRAGQPWKVQSPRMEHLSRQIVEAAPRLLMPVT